MEMITDSAHIGASVLAFWLQMWRFHSCHMLFAFWKKFFPSASPTVRGSRRVGGLSVGVTLQFVQMFGIKTFKNPV